MFDDPNKELEQLQEQLLQDEEWFRRELDSAKRMIGQAPEAKPQRPSAPRTSQAPRPNPAQAAPARSYGDGYSQTAPQPRLRQLSAEEEAPMPRKKGIKGLLILAAIETLGIVGLAAYWALVLLR